MEPRIPKFCLLVVAAHLVALPLTAQDQVSSEAVRFNQHVRPILSEKCFRCHGPDQANRKAGLRLDLAEAAVADRDGLPAIKPHSLTQSEAWRRITAEDASERMPPPGSGLSLKPGEIDILRRWIEQGAEYDRHWSLAAPVRPRSPSLHDTTWTRDRIDHFVLARLEHEGLRPAPEASRETLLRRVTFDLTGLPPTLEELDAFLADASPDAYERRVDHLLASPRYGERMSADWLDAARYADTNGYFSDFERPIWPWRDWVIRAFNQNMPFDQFTLEQLAGDLLPDPTVDQRIATGFNRNHPVTNESGAIDEEYRVEYVADRLETTAAVWLGLTVGCARCHDHKYDPISQREYYQLFAFFNNGPEKGLVSDKAPPPVLSVPTEEQARQLTMLRQRRDAAEEAWRHIEARLQPEIQKWTQAAIDSPATAPADRIGHYAFDDNLTNAAADRLHAVPRGTLRYELGLVGRGLELEGTTHAEVEGDVPLHADRPWTVMLWFRSGAASLGCLFSKIEPHDRRTGVELLWKKGRLTANLVHHWGQSALSISGTTPLTAGQWQHVALVYDGSAEARGLRIFANGSLQPVTVEQDTLLGPISNAEPLRIGRRDTGLGWYGRIDEFHIVDKALSEKEVVETYERDLLRHLGTSEAAQQFQGHRDWLTTKYLAEQGTSDEQSAWHAVRRLRRDLKTLEASIPQTLVMQDLPQPRPTHVLERGQYDAPAELVAPAVPACVPALPAELPNNRLGLARWLVDGRNPLTARVAVNRAWQQFFGTGLVKTVSDFGAQGEWPSHPEVLDELAVGFVESAWDVKALHRRIVTSATYRQSAVAAAEVMARDPENRWLARGPRFRLSGEALRDQALATAGLLVERLGGPSVKPYQPPGLWEAVSYDGELSYEQDRGENLYRRSLYTFWKRQAPPPAALAFDGAPRETCTLRRQPTNTPLQALVLLNDPTWLEAARVFATELLSKTDLTDRARIVRGFLTVASRSPDDEEITRLLKFLNQQREEFRRDPESVKRLLQVGDSPVKGEVSPSELAAWTTFVSVLFNLDEAITRP